MVDRSWFTRQAYEYEQLARGSDMPIDYKNLHPCDDRNGGASFDAHYAHCDLWASGKIKDLTATHVDVGSRVDGFCTHVLAAGGSVEHVDIRDPGFWWRDFSWRKDDARTLATFPDGSVDSLSCLHSCEHVGLGRYGDDIDPDGMRKCMSSLARILAPGGRLYFAVPIGRHRVVFNAHRVASPRWVSETFAKLGLTLNTFAAVDDAGAWHPEADPADYENANYSCGMFEMVRR